MHIRGYIDDINAYKLYNPIVGKVTICRDV